MSGLRVQVPIKAGPNGSFKVPAGARVLGYKPTLIDGEIMVLVEVEYPKRARP